VPGRVSVPAILVLVLAMYRLIHQLMWWVVMTFWSDSNPDMCAFLLTAAARAGILGV